VKSRLISKSVLIATTATAIASGIGGYIWNEEHRPPVLELYIFPLKGSEAIFIRTPDDRRILINGGPNSEVIRNISRVLPFYTRRLDTVIATDLSDTHVTGLIDVVERYHVGEAHVPRVTLESLGLASSNEKASKNFFSALKKHSVTLHLASVEEDSQIDSGEQVAVDILFPVDQISFPYSRASAPEIVLQIVHGSNSLLIAGDSSKKVQKFIASSTELASIATGEDVGRVLILSTAGGASDLSAELMELYAPDYFVYSKAVSYKAPDQRTSTKKDTDPLRPVSVEKRFNVREGGVKIISDGTELRVSRIR
jgi:beta-lactamase superfamily II metal-dependent hydrolase